MANEITTTAAPGQSLTVRLMQGASAVGSAIAMTESGTQAGYYTADKPAGLADGSYVLLVLAGSAIVGQAVGIVRGGNFVDAAVPGDAMALTSGERTSVTAGHTATQSLINAAALTNQAEHDATQAAVAMVIGIGDPLTRQVPGTYPAGSAGEALGKLVVGPPDEPAVVLPGAPAATDICRVYGYIESADNLKLPNVTVQLELLPANVAVGSERLVAGRKVTLKTDAQGRLIGPTGDPWVDLQRTDVLAADGDADVYYEVTSAGLGVHRRRVELTTATADLRTLLITPAA